MQQRSCDAEEGFTLVELLIAMLIIGILVGIVLPTYMGARERAQNVSVQSALRNGLATAKIWHAASDSYAGFDETRGEAIEPSLAWVPLADPALGEVAVGASASDVHLVGESASGTFFCLHDGTGTGTSYGSGASYAAVSTEGLCAGAAW
jgi:type IV pilus assembly protein PilA